VRAGLGGLGEFSYLDQLPIIAAWTVSSRRDLLK
jgi:hypothetical protein